MREGMTLKEHARHRFYSLLERYRTVKATGLKTEDQKAEFVSLSIQIHITKNQVPKRLWPLVNR